MGLPVFTRALGHSGTHSMLHHHFSPYWPSIGLSPMFQFHIAKKNTQFVSGFPVIPCLDHIRSAQEWDLDTLIGIPYILVGGFFPILKNDGVRQ
jgi:hypothetical protein